MKDALLTNTNKMVETVVFKRSVFKSQAGVPIYEKGELCFTYIYYRTDPGNLNTVNSKLWLNSKF